MAGAKLVFPGARLEVVALDGWFELEMHQHGLLRPLKAAELSDGTLRYLLLVAGFFVCGFQLAFITVHLPPYLAEHGISKEFAGIAMSLIGLFNVAGSYLSGIIGGRGVKRKIQSPGWTPPRSPCRASVAWGSRAVAERGARRRCRRLDIRITLPLRLLIFPSGSTTCAYEQWKHFLTCSYPISSRHLKTC